MHSRKLSVINLFNMSVASHRVYREDGAVLVVALIFLGILALVGATATIITTTDIKIGANYKASEQALYVAEAGAQEARERLRLKPDTDPAFPNIINDGHATNHEWAAYIGESTKAQKKGYVVGNPVHVYTTSVQTGTDIMDYTVVITHQIDPSDPTKVLYWGDSDSDGDLDRHTDATKSHPNIYLITSYGNAEGATGVVQMEVIRSPSITASAALYTGSSAWLIGNAYVTGDDGCGDDDLPGIATDQDYISDDDPVEISGTAQAIGGGGAPGIAYGSDDPPVEHIDVSALVTALKASAKFSYTFSADKTQTATETPGPGDGWGTPTTQTDLTLPSSCDDYNIVHYNMNGYSIKLMGGVSGCGVLLVEGDLDVSGGFSWYGPVLVTGALKFTGGGDKNITGAVISGDNTDGDLVGGNTNIVYCSEALNSLKYQSLCMLNWKQQLVE